MYNESKDYREFWLTLHQSGWLKVLFHVKIAGLINVFSVFYYCHSLCCFILEPFITCVTLYLGNFRSRLKYFNLLV